MENGFLWGLCTCTGTHICLPCKILTGACLAALAGLVVYLIGRRPKKPPQP